MIKDVLDTHTHTIASGHAYSTIQDNVKIAIERGYELLGITEHAPKLPGSCHEMYFQNLRVVDRYAHGIELLMGAELNILDAQGNMDLEQDILKKLDIVIASLHIHCIQPGSREFHTEACIQAMKNPYVNILGHPDDGRYPVDMRAVVQCAKEQRVLLELNNSSLRPDASRKNAREQDVEMLKLCMEYRTPIVIGSDAHVDLDVGKHEFALELLEEMEFPEELVVNRSVEELKKYLS